MIKMTQAFLTGLFFAFILDFILFLGLKLHYIDHHGIDVYFNTLFADNQNAPLFFGLVLLIGWIALYWKSKKASYGIIGFFFLIVSAVLIPPFGEKTGDMLFRKKHIEITRPPHVYRGDIVYTDRHKLYFYDTDLQRIITLPKEK